MKLSSNSLGPTLPLTVINGGPRLTRTDASPSHEVNQDGAADRQRLLIVATSTASARAIQNALVPVDQKPLLRDTQNGSCQTFHPDGAQIAPVPLLTFARSVAGADFCLADGADPSNAAPVFDAVLWEFPQEDPDALVTAQKIGASAGSIPVIAILIQAPPQVDALAEAGMFAGLLSMVPVAELNTTLLDELIGAPSSHSESLSESVDQLCQAIRTHSHDIRNPLNCVQMLVDLMRSHTKYSEPIPPTIFDQLSASVERADAIVSQLSNLAKARRRDLCSSPTS